jgi:hypothetical protein
VYVYKSTVSLPGYAILIVALFVLLPCNRGIVRENKPVEKVSGVKVIAKSDIDNVFDVHIRESQRLLKELILKLYVRNSHAFVYYRFNVDDYEIL